MMKAAVIDKPGDSKAFVIKEVAIPKPKPGHVVVKNGACGVNFIDTYQRSGFYPVPMPVTLGREGAGTLHAVASDVKGFKPGQRVAWCLVGGGYAEYSEVPISRIAALPDSVSDRDGCQMMIQGLTAHYLATSSYPLAKGDVALVHAGAGGTGALLVQIAKLRGATVITTVSTDEKAAIAKEAGADHVILYTKQDFVEEVNKITNNAGVNVVYDGIGSTTFTRGLLVLKPRGTMVSFGQAAGPVEPFVPGVLAKRSLYLHRPKLADFVPTQAEFTARASELIAWLASGQLKLRHAASFPLAEAGKAHEFLEARKTTGKVVLLP